MFHGKLLRERWRGTFSLADIANMDQALLPFVMDDGKTYNQTGSKEILCASGSSGLEKRQCTIQLTIFADGVSGVRPLVIFRGKGLRIKAEEKGKWDKRVKVLFPKNGIRNGINLPYLSMSHQTVQADFSHSMFLSASHLNM